MFAEAEAAGRPVPDADGAQRPRPISYGQAARPAARPLSAIMAEEVAASQARTAAAKPERPAFSALLEREQQRAPPAPAVMDASAMQTVAEPKRKGAGGGTQGRRQSNESDDEESFWGPAKPQRMPPKTRQGFLANLITDATGMESVEEFAETIVGERREEMIRKLGSICERQVAVGIADRFFKQFPR
jgi:hypothetical protein